VLTASLATFAETKSPTYAERLGWKPGDRVVIFHVDDTGMSHDSNVGTFESMEKGVATSASVMFPCPWVSEFAAYYKEHPDMDAGVHATLNSEWKKYRFGPVAGKKAVPGLTDPEGCLWRSGADTLAHASADEVETELRAQVERALTIGIKPTHIDTHMGTIVSRQDYAERYVKVGIEYGIPVMIVAGRADTPNREFGSLVDKVWKAGLPVLDNLHTASYGWKDLATKKAGMWAMVKALKPGITQVIVHCTKPSESFVTIADSGPLRLADLQVMIDPEFKKLLQDEKIILTTWRELKERRDKVK
jgi:hypothetical protein